MDPRPSPAPVPPYSNSNTTSQQASPFSPSPAASASAAPSQTQPFAHAAAAQHHHHNHNHHRRPSDTSFYQSSRPHPPDTAHSRNLSTSSLPSARELSRGMPPPPNSPPQPGSQQPPPQHHHHHHHHHHHPQSQQQQQQQQQPPPQQQQQQQSSQSHGMGGYGPPPPRPPPVAVGPPTSFPSGRELPALSSITRSGSGGSGGSSMSISSMLGGPPPVPRDSQPSPAQHYPPHTAAPGSGAQYASSVHASPQISSASSEYAGFRRPHTPDHPRPYDPRAPPTAASPPHGPYSTTPEVQRYGTPQAYHSRHPSASADPAREPGRTSVGPPPRPSSQPKSYPGGPPPRPMDMGRGPPPDEPYGRRDDHGRPAPGMEYNPDRTGLRPYPFDDRYRAERERPGELERERDKRERAYSGSDSGRHHLPPHDLGHRDPARNQGPPYGHPPDERDRRDSREAHWGRQGPDSSGYRPPIDHQRGHPGYPPPNQPYAPHGSPYQTAPPERYPPPSHPSAPQNSTSAPPPQQPYGSPERGGLPQHAPPHPKQPSHRPRPGEEGPPPFAAGSAYNGTAPYDAHRGRPGDEPAGPGGLQRNNLLAVQDINRKGRISPLPQAVQGAQPQQPGPAAEPGIKSEFGRMFAGIGSGVSAIGVSSPITSGGAQMPFSSAPLTKREEPDAGAPDSGTDGPKTTKGRRRKLKDSATTDGQGGPDDDSSGRATPSGKAKRAKGQHHHHHHHHHHHAPDSVSSAALGITSFKNFKNTTPAASPTEKTAPPHVHHHHHHHHGPRTSHPPHGQPVKPAAQNQPTVIPPKPKTTVSSKAALEAVAHRPRHHLGDFIYEPGLTAARLLPNNPSHRGFASNPKPLPWEVIRGNENCTLTVKVPRIHLTPTAREEITARGFLWGTDVYTDDSDVVAACIHGGWIKGEWAEDIDASMLEPDQAPNGNETKRRKTKNQAADAVNLESELLINSPPASGPMSVPPNRDLHVNVLILPRLIKYSSVTRYGITSREFGGEFGGRHVVHDGISFMIIGVRWVANGAQPQARLRGKARRERMRKAMKEIKGSLGNISGAEREQEKERINRLRSEITGNWWKKETAEPAGDKDQNERQVSEGDKENRAADEQSPKQTDKPDTEGQERDTEMKDADDGAQKAEVGAEK